MQEYGHALASVRNDLRAVACFALIRGDTSVSDPVFPFFLFPNISTLYFGIKKARSFYCGLFAYIIYG